MASTVPVTSRSAYSLRSAGASPDPAWQMTAPTSSSCAIISSLLSAARQPGIDSSLSSVPPVWPRPRPDSCGTATPNTATSGASGSVILSPTPPVECLSAVGRDSPEKSIRSPLAIMAAVQRAISARSMPLSRIAMLRADICSSATTPRVYASMTQSICASDSRCPSRLATMTSTASNCSLMRVPPGRPVRTRPGAPRSSASRRASSRPAAALPRAPTGAAGTGRTA